MSDTTIRISSKTHALLHELARAAGVSPQDILDQALAAYRQQQLVTIANQGYAALKADAGAWQDYQREQQEWDETLNDGLED